MSKPSIYYVDSSVVLRAIVDGSPAARRWFDAAQDARDRFVASRLLELEVRRVIKNADLNDKVADAYLDEFVLIALTDDLINEAVAINERLGGADALHIATALRIGTAATVVTHDDQMAKAAQNLGFDVIDPVTDDPRRGPVVS